MSEPEFWHRYFQSKLFNSHRASIRSAAAQHVVKDDPIFDKYLEKEDDGKHARATLFSDIDIPPQSWSRADCAKTGWISSLTLALPRRTMARSV